MRSLLVTISYNMMVTLGFCRSAHFVRAFVPNAIHRASNSQSLRDSSRGVARFGSASATTNGGSGTNNLVSVEESLEAFKSGGDNIVFVDGSFYHKGERNGRTEFEAGPRLPGAKFMDMLDISTSKDLYPELNPQGLYAMLPPKDLFAATMDAFDIKNSDRVIIYGREGTTFTPRTWFLFRTMGHENVQLMQGSLEDWKTAGGPVDENPTTVLPAKDLDTSQPLTYKAQDPFDVVDMDYMLKIVQKEGEATIVDPRGSSFAKKGYMPGAIHLPYSSLVEPDNKLKLKSSAELEKLFEAAGVDIQSEKPIVCSCGSGVSVCHVYLALQECGRKGDTVIYDGSWNEWSQNLDAPKVVPEK